MILTIDTAKINITDVKTVLRYSEHCVKQFLREKYNVHKTLEIEDDIYLSSYHEESKERYQQRQERFKKGKQKAEKEYQKIQRKPKMNFSN